MCLRRFRALGDCPPALRKRPYISLAPDYPVVSTNLYDLVQVRDFGLMITSPRAGQDPVESNAGARSQVGAVAPFWQRLNPADYTRFPASGRRTVRADIQHTALGLVSRPDMRPASTWCTRQVEETLFIEEPFRCEALCPSPREFVPTCQKAGRAVEQELHPRYASTPFRRRSSGAIRRRPG
jgi:hypothetical protein